MLQQKSLLKRAMDISMTLVLIVVATLFIRVYVVEARIVPTESMTPTVQPGDRVLVDRFFYRFLPPRRGDVIVFDPPNTANLQSVLDTDYLKRVIGLPGEQLAIHGGTVIVDDRVLYEPYLASSWLGDYDVVVPAEDYFVMGDNRPNSYDSRYWGTLPGNRVRGRALAVYWPPAHARWLVPWGEVIVNIVLLGLVLAVTLRLSSAAEARLTKH